METGVGEKEPLDGIDRAGHWRPAVTKTEGRFVINII